MYTTIIITALLMTARLIAAVPIQPQPALEVPRSDPCAENPDAKIKLHADVYGSGCRKVIGGD